VIARLLALSAVLSTTLLVVAAPAVHASPCAYATASIAVVVDFGDGGSISTVCVPVDGTPTDAAVLQQRSQQLGTPSPTYNSSGLLCSIDGYPSSGCGERTGDQFAYWSYWHGTTAGWTYGNDNPAVRKAKSSVTIGWRFQPQGSASPNDPPPRASSDPALTCVPEPPPTEPTTATTTSVMNATPTSMASNASVLASTITTLVAPDDSITTIITTSSTTSSTATERAGAPVRVTPRVDGGGPAWGLIAGGGLILAIGSAGAVLSRRRGALGP
jgi:hypothetical protein